MKIQRIIEREPGYQWVIKFEGNIGLLMEWEGGVGAIVSMSTEIDALDSGFLRAMAKQIEAITFMADKHDEQLQDDPGDGYTTIFIVITDGEMNELLKQYKS